MKIYYRKIKRRGSNLSDDDEMKDGEELIRYYKNNREGLLPYQSQGLELPEGLEY